MCTWVWNREDLRRCFFSLKDRTCGCRAGNFMYIFFLITGTVCFLYRNSRSVGFYNRYNRYRSVME